MAAGAAATSWVLKDGVSYVVKIGYGSLFGARFDDDPKSWRIAADVVEDLGGAIEILTPLFPRRYFLPLASLAVCLRGMSLMTGTATRHVVYRSLAARGMQNTGDIATKGESQGVTCKMIGLAAGIIISSRIGQKYYALLAAYSLLSAVHIVANWKSVQCVQFAFLNKQRASILLDHFLDGREIPSPYETSRKERVVLPPWRGYDPSIRLGASVKQAGGVVSQGRVERASKLFKNERFLILRDDGGRDGGREGGVGGRRKRGRSSSGDRYVVFLREKASAMDALKAYYVVKRVRTRKTEEKADEVFESSVRDMEKKVSVFVKKVEAAGWDTRHMLLSDGQARVDW